MTRITVVVPSYNHAPFIGECLDSVLCQSRQPDQIIVVDDGSQDATRAVLEAYSGRVRIVLNAHAGLRVSTRLGLSLSDGDYILFLASDDRLHPEALRILAGALDRYSDVAISYGEIDRIDESGHHISYDRIVRPYGRHRDPNRLIADNYVPAPVALCRRKVLIAVGEPHALHCGDWERWLKVTFAGWYLYGTDQILADYRRHGQNLSDPEGVDRRLGEEARMLDRLSKDAKTPPRLRRLLSASCGMRFRRLGWWHMERRQWNAARVAFWRGLAYPGWKPLDGLTYLTTELPPRWVERIRRGR